MTETTTDAVTHAEEMRAAATKLREAAEQCADTTSWYSTEDFAHSLCGADAPWLALMSPDKAEPLADLLDGFAEIGGRNSHALALARLINGTAS